MLDDDLHTRDNDDNREIRVLHRTEHPTISSSECSPNVLFRTSNPWEIVA